MSKRPYPQGVVEVGDGFYAYLQPNGSWGLSNAGLVTSDGASLLVDTLFDLPHTEAMLEALRRASAAAERIGTVVNTHANGDHCWGNQLVQGARIVSSRRTAEEMRGLPPKKVALLLRVARLLSRLGPLGRGLGAAGRAVGLAKIDHLVEAAPFVEQIFGRFRFSGIELTLPDTIFDGSLDLEVGSRRVSLLEVGPAHTEGDVLVFVADARAVFTGDILFVDAHPIVWEGPVSNWIAACDRILELEPEVVVPGHGPLADLKAVRRVREYLVYVEEEARKRHAARMSSLEAALDIALDGFSTWSEAERIAVNVETVYGHLEGRTDPPDIVEMFARMATVARARRRLGSP